ncbi:MAG: 5'-methylthioadenosine/S-adenosylhomocysteine nucleosidase [Culicoidibacterales bacterium]
MRIAIIGAMEEEVQLLRAQLTERQTDHLAGFEFYVGKLAGKDVVVLRSGIGKVNAAVSTTLLLNHYDISAVINTGSAGGVNQSLNVGDIVIATETTYHDVDATHFGYVHGQVPQMPAHYLSDQTLVQAAQQALATTAFHAVTGVIATGDSFIGREEQITAIVERQPVLSAVEMEAGAVAQVCHIFNKPFVIVRSISDVAGKESHLSFEQFLPLAVEQSTSMIMAMLPLV